jgi:hypothetical protein
MDVFEFSMKEYKKRYKDQYPQRKLLYAFVKKCQNLTFKVNFQVYQNVKNHLDFSDFFFSFTIQEHPFRRTIFENFNFWNVSSSKMVPNF